MQSAYSEIEKELDEARERVNRVCDETGLRRIPKRRLHKFVPGYRPDNFVYFVQCGEDGPIKIGTAKDLRMRLSSLQIGCPYELRLLGAREGDMLTESELHRRFARYRIRGEWFEPSEGLLREIEPCRGFPRVW